jgi:hypothetical protein
MTIIAAMARSHWIEGITVLGAVEAAAIILARFIHSSQFYAAECADLGQWSARRIAAGIIVPLGRA